MKTKEMRLQRKIGNSASWRACVDAVRKRKLEVIAQKQLRAEKAERLKGKGSEYTEADDRSKLKMNEPKGQKERMKKKRNKNRRNDEETREDWYKCKREERMKRKKHSQQKGKQRRGRVHGV